MTPTFDMAKKIAALIADLSGNSIVRSYPIIKVLQRKYDVQVIGVTRSGPVFEPYRESLTYTLVSPARGCLWPERTARKVASCIDADAVYCFKPVAFSFGAGLLAHLTRRMPLILDVEDFDNVAFASQGRLWKALAPIRNLTPAEDRLALMDWVVDLLHGFAKQKTVGSRFLQARYGGTRLSHGADPAMFDPTRYSRERARQLFGFQGKRVILFAGTVRKHKGLETTCRALQQLKDSRCVLAVCGVLTEVLKELREKYPDVLLYLGPQPHNHMPLLWLAADLVVLAQEDTPYTRAQVPGKVFEAMAMERPIVASSVSDLPEILADCGWLVEPANVEAITEAIHEALASPEDAADRGRRARTRYLENYSWDVMERILNGVMAKVF